MATEFIRVSVHSQALKFGRAKDPRKPELEDILENKSIFEACKQQKITTIGYDLTLAQAKVLFAAQKLLDRTDFEGSSKPVKPTQPEVYHFYGKLPVLNVKLSEYLDAYGVKKGKSKRGKMEYNAEARRIAIAALKRLAEQKFLLVYEKSKGEDSRKKVRVEAIAPLLKLNRDDRRITIVPNPVLVDHIDSYFILLPDNFFSIIQGRNPTRARFLEFLFYHAQMHRKEEVRFDKSSYEIRVQPEVIAAWLRMDGLLASRQKNRMRKQLDTLYAYGVSTGYLDSYASNQEGTKKRIVDVLKLKKAKFEEFKKPQGLVPTVAKSTRSERKV